MKIICETDEANVFRDFANTGCLPKAAREIGKPSRLRTSRRNVARDHFEAVFLR
jgi:hypothetical protein